MNFTQFSSTIPEPKCYVRKMVKCIDCYIKTTGAISADDKSYKTVEGIQMIAYFLIGLGMCLAVGSLVFIFIFYIKTTLTYCDRTNINNSRIAYFLLSKSYLTTVAVYAIEISTLWFIFYNSISLNVFDEFYLWCNFMALSQLFFQFCHSFLYYSGSERDMGKNGFERVGFGLLILMPVSLATSYLAIIAVTMSVFDICLFLTIFNYSLVFVISLVNLYFLKSEGDTLTKDLIFKHTKSSAN